MRLWSVAFAAQSPAKLPRDTASHCIHIHAAVAGRSSRRRARGAIDPRRTQGRGGEKRLATSRRSALSQTQTAFAKRGQGHTRAQLAHAYSRGTKRTYCASFSQQHNVSFCAHAPRTPHADLRGYFSCWVLRPNCRSLARVLRSAGGLGESSVAPLFRQTVAYLSQSSRVQRAAEAGAGGSRSR